MIHHALEIVIVSNFFDDVVRVVLVLSFDFNDAFAAERTFPKLLGAGAANIVPTRLQTRFEALFLQTNAARVVRRDDGRDDPSLEVAVVRCPLG